GGRPLTQKERALFAVNMILPYAMYGAPVDLLSHILFTFYMVQMAFVLFLIAPLLYFSIPDYLQKYLVTLPVIGPVLRLGAKKPLYSLMLLIASFSIYHLPVVMDNLRSEERRVGEDYLRNLIAIGNYENKELKK